jgi:hypothetical protein
MRAQYIQLIGVEQAGSWEFYIQLKSPTIPRQTVLSLTHLQWRPWGETFYHTY